MKIGFTGTRWGMTQRQRDRVAAVLVRAYFSELHHGDCKGADSEIHDLVRGAFPGKAIIGHPPSDSKLRAFRLCDAHREPKPYLERDHNIVDETDLLIACPGTMHEELRSGTWATVRYAVKSDKPVYLIYPDGSFHENFPFSPLETLYAPPKK